MTERYDNSFQMIEDLIDICDIHYMNYNINKKNIT